MDSRTTASAPVEVAFEAFEGISDMQRVQLKEWFEYHQPSAEDAAHYARINDAARELARTIMQCTPRCADQSAALRLVREARMTANAAIACKGV